MSATTEKDPELVVVIMAGGAGTRFWPLSTNEKPKQFLNLFGSRSLLQKSFDRVKGLVPGDRILVLTNNSLVELVREQLPELPAANVIGEPMRRDTAAAVSLAALICRRRYGNPVMCVLTADHLIEPVEEFQRTLLSAATEAACEPVLYTLGIQPVYPATCYGYLERGEKVTSSQGIDHYRLLRFVEKPDSRRAEKYFASGRFYWNSGMFIWSVDTILGEFERQLPEHIQHLGPAVEADCTPGWDRALTKGFESLKAISIDFGIMEGAARVRTIQSAFEWNDVGGWLAMEDYLTKDGSGNAARGRVEALDSSGNLVFCENETETVALVDVEGLVVVRAGDRTLIVPREKAERIKELVKRLETKE
ncbi:MAG: sugar phosphate nucleotidyltransferase [Gemmatimonadota bacterium]|nr:sugar phosphate nucleotidyltransferase [Gemmatimonadota bacterium]